MDIQTMQNRIYFLAGALEEAKRMLQDAVGEINATNKEQVNNQPNTETPTENK